MQGSPKIIEFLNEALTSELTAINQYFAHAKICENWGYHRLAAKYREESVEEMNDAEKLMDRILLLDGMPNMQRLNSVRIGETVPEQLAVDRSLEEHAIAMYRRGVALALERGRSGDPGVAGTSRGGRGGAPRLDRDPAAHHSPTSGSSGTCSVADSTSEPAAAEARPAIGSGHGRTGPVPHHPPPGVRRHDLRGDVRSGGAHGRHQSRSGLPRHRRAAGGAAGRRGRHRRRPQPVPARDRHPRVAPCGLGAPEALLRPLLRPRQRGADHRRGHRGHRLGPALAVRGGRRGGVFRAVLRQLRRRDRHGRSGPPAGAAARPRVLLRARGTRGRHRGRAPGSSC